MSNQQLDNFGMNKKRKKTKNTNNLLLPNVHTLVTPMGDFTGRGVGVENQMTPFMGGRIGGDIMEKETLERREIPIKKKDEDLMEYIAKLHFKEMKVHYEYLRSLDEVVESTSSVYSNESDEEDEDGDDLFVNKKKVGDLSALNKGRGGGGDDDEEAPMYLKKIRDIIEKGDMSKENLKYIYESEGFPCEICKCETMLHREDHENTPSIDLLKGALENLSCGAYHVATNVRFFRASFEEVLMREKIKFECWSTLRLFLHYNGDCGTGNPIITSNSLKNKLSNIATTICKSMALTDKNGMITVDNTPCKLLLSVISEIKDIDNKLPTIQKSFFKTQKPQKRFNLQNVSFVTPEFSQYPTQKKRKNYFEGTKKNNGDSNSIYDNDDYY